MNYHFLKSSLFVLVGMLLLSTIVYSQRPDKLLDRDFNFIDIQHFSKSDFFSEDKSPYKVLKTYDENWRLIEEIEQNWYVNEWVIIQKSTYTYDDNNNQIEYLFQRWVNNNDWLNYSKFTYTYDENNNQIEWLIQSCFGNECVNSSKYTYTYDENNNPIELLRQDWIDNDWVNYSKFTYVYEEILDTDISDITSIPNHYNLSNPYPNPFNPTTTIEFSIPRSDMVSIKVYDILGKEITTLLTDYLTVGNHSIKWDGNNNSSGIYFIRMESGGFMDMKKVFLLK